MSARLAAGCALSRFHGGVGGADDPVPAPRDHEQHRLLGAHDEAGLGADPVARHDQVDALAGLHVQRAAAADHLLDLVGPDPGGVDHDAGPDLEVALVLEVARADADDPLALAQEAGDLDPGRDVRAVAGGGAGDRHHQPGVVDLAVVVLDRAGDRVGLEVGRDPGDLPLEEVPVPRHAHVVLAEHRHGVVEREPGADVRALPAAVGQRVEERHRPDQVRRQPGEQQPALLQRLAHQAEVEHLEVAQAAVDQLAAAAAGAAGQVALLEQPGVEAAGDGVERGAGADHSPADHQDVELACRSAHRGDRGVAGGRAQCGGGPCGGRLMRGFFQAPTQPLRPPESLLDVRTARSDPRWRPSSVPHRHVARDARRLRPDEPTADPDDRARRPTTGARVPSRARRRAPSRSRPAYRVGRDGRRPALAQHGVAERGRGRRAAGRAAATTSTRCSRRCGR